MPTFLFWNIQKKPLALRVARIVAAYGVDVVLLAECEEGVGDFTRALNARTPEPFRPKSQTVCGLRAWFKHDLSSWVAVQVGERWLTFRHTTPPETHLLVGHLPSRFHTDEHDQRLVVRSLAADIRGLEDRRGHLRTVVVGDFNMNPFDAGVTAFDELHAVMCRTVAGREVRTVRGKEDRLFYNPMWGLFGDRTPGPPGTYYRSRGGVVNYYWHLYDQVLLRPAIADALTDLRILDTDGEESLVTADGLPDQRSASDHLPILFRLNFSEVS